MDDRDEEEADTLLLAASSSSSNQSNAPAYSAYRSLHQHLRMALLRSIMCSTGLRALATPAPILSVSYSTPPAETNSRTWWTD